LTKAVLILGDVLAFALSGLLAAWLARGWGEVQDAHWLVSQDFERYASWLIMTILGLVFFLVRHRHYIDRKPFWTELPEILNVLLVLAVLDLALIGIARWNSSRLWWGLVWPISALFLPLGRGMLRSLMRKLHLWQRPTLVIGDGPNAYDAVEALKSEPALGFEVLGLVQGNELLQDATNALQELAKLPGIQFVVALEAGKNEQREDVLRKLAQYHAEDVSVIPAMRGIPLFGTDIVYFFSHEVAMLKLRNNLRFWPARILKRVFDLLAALVLLVLIALPFFCIALLIRRDGGGAIFAHQRVGRSGVMFPCFKFRTMHLDAEKQLEDLLINDPAAQAEWERDFKLQHDPRVTRIGKFLRRTSLDELPQLFNVIRGEMSLVGPRPIIRAELDRYGQDLDYFLMVLPGMTGLWQISGRSDTGYDVRVYLDTWYVKNWSLWYDIAILFKTVKVVFGGKGAY
jgi:Undecaprenyl-phosphate galactose phosphotransferase WbaP